MEAVARLRHYRGSAQKVRLVADLIRMKPVGRALAMLRATPKGCAPDLKKLVESAVANAQQNGSGVDADALVVSRILVDGAGRKPLQRNAMLRSVSNYKKRYARPRFMSGPQGRMWLVTRPFCHVTVHLSDDPVVRRKAGLAAEPARPVAKKKGGKVAAAVAKAAARPTAPRDAAKAAPKGEGKPKAPRANKSAKAPEPAGGQE